MEAKTLTENPDLINSGFDCPPDNPLDLLQSWLYTADLLKTIEPRGLVLSTINTQNAPSSRIVLLKTVDEKGVTFASSETSQKGRDLQTNPAAAGTLWWRETMQQINFQGTVTKLANNISDEIFKERPPAAQAVATISTQSAPMTNEQKLRTEVSKILAQSEPISRPKTWHGYHISIETIEFWHGNKDRFHHRLRYELKNKIWRHLKLQP
jgi:pyridoxamine 5'-phosphate oxidase